MKHLHEWNISYARARELQNELSEKIEITKLPRRPGIVAGLDCAFSKNGRRIGAAVVLYTFPELQPIETKSATGPVHFPYVPGLLSFREAPVCLSAVKKLKNSPDLYLIDGQGMAHPRYLGLAAHLGLFLEKPTIGCAKSRLTGRFETPGPEKGFYTPLKDEKDPSQTIGAVLRTRTNVKPLFVSVGHKTTLDDAIYYTLACTTKYRNPEPLRYAHRTVTNLKPYI